MDLNKIKKKILLFYDTLDKSGINSKMWKDRFSKMSDEQLIKYLENMETFTLHSIPYKNQPKYHDIKETLDSIGVPMEEHLYYPDSETGKILKTKYKVPVGYLHIKRLQQIVSKKNNFSYSITKRNSLTNQVTGDDKVANSTNMESYALNVYGADNTLRELLGARADNNKAKLQMYRDIKDKGYFKLSDIDEDIASKSVVNMMDIYLLGSGLKSDLISPDLYLLQTFEKEDL